MQVHKIMQLVHILTVLYAHYKIVGICFIYILLYHQSNSNAPGKGLLSNATSWDRHNKQMLPQCPGGWVSLDLTDTLHRLQLYGSHKPFEAVQYKHTYHKAFGVGTL